MSLTGLALSDRKVRLRPTLTRVTRPDGRVELERDGTTEETSDRESGFVIDTQPDLSISEVSVDERERGQTDFYVSDPALALPLQSGRGC